EVLVRVQDDRGEVRGSRTDGGACFLGGVARSDHGRLAVQVIPVGGTASTATTLDRERVGGGDGHDVAVLLKAQCNGRSESHYASSSSSSTGTSTTAAGSGLSADTGTHSPFSSRNPTVIVGPHCHCLRLKCSEPRGQVLKNSLEVGSRGVIHRASERRKCVRVASSSITACSLLTIQGILEACDVRDGVRVVARSSLSRTRAKSTNTRSASSRG